MRVLEQSGLSAHAENWRFSDDFGERLHYEIDRQWRAKFRGRCSSPPTAPRPRSRVLQILPRSARGSMRNRPPANNVAALGVTPSAIGEWPPRSMAIDETPVGE